MSSAVDRLNILKGHLNEAKSSSTEGKRRFRFTLDNTSLQDEQRIFYELNGYIVIKNLVAHHHLDRFIQRFKDICDGKVNKGGLTLMKDLSLIKTGVTGEYLYNKLQDFMWDEVLFDYCAMPEVVDIVKCFTGPNVLTINTMLINKPPDSGSETSRHPLHQDMYYFPFRPADRIVCSWTAMEKVTRENGCLVVIPGTHKGILHPHDYPEWENGVNKMYHGIKGYEGHDRVHLTMEKGDTVFFHPMLIHGSGANRTKGFRKAISCHYAASECNYIDIRGTIHESVSKEMEETAAKLGIPLDYISYWKSKSRLVTGNKVNM